MFVVKQHRSLLTFLMKRNFNFSYCQLHIEPPFYFVTTPIFYVNAAPHIGHLQSCLYADALSRVHHLLGYKTLFSTGTDEHGLKIQQAAAAVAKEPLELCETVSKQFTDVFDQTGISHTHFTRTTSKKHVAAVHAFWEELCRKGCIYKGEYSGWYSISEETFVPSSQIKEVTDASGTTMVSADSGQPLQEMKEENYIFGLSKFKDDLLYWLSTGVVQPSMYAEDLYRYLKEDLCDISISRQRSRLKWGIPVPGDPNHTIYVWLDALVNYLTAAGYPDQKMIWPPDCQVIGKDILKFHGIYWPAFLIAADLEPPRSIFCHSHWTVDYEKMSKSKGNVIDPLPLLNKYGCDGLRYFLLRAAVPHSDANYSEAKIFRLLNAELADTLGNLLSRCTAPAVNKKQIFPEFSKTTFDSLCGFNGHKFIQSASTLPDVVLKHYMQGDFYKGLEFIMLHVRDANGFMQLHKPWELAKCDDVDSQKKLDTLLHLVLETLRITGLLLQPIVPSMASDLLTKIGVPEDKRNLNDMQCFLSYAELPNCLQGVTLGQEKTVLFSRRKM